MTLPTYPTNDFNQGSQLLAQLGSFWFNIFEDWHKLQVHMRSSGYEAAQTYLNYLETIATLSRFEVPVFHTEDWYLLTARQSDSDSIPSIYQAGDLVYGGQTGLVAGRPAGFVQTYGGTDNPNLRQVRMPDNLVDCPFVLQNLVVHPSKTWVVGVDYDIDKNRNLIRFRDDPFADPLVAKRDVVDSNGDVVDTEIGIWVYKGNFDLNYIWIHFGYVLGIKLGSSEFYKDLVNAVWDARIIGGLTQATLTRFLAAMSGAPTVLSPQETVEVVRTEETSQLIVTDVHVYRAPLGAWVNVMAGDVVYLGDVLTDAFEVVELSTNAPDYSLIPAMAMSNNFLSGGYFAELSFRNHDVALEYLGLDENNKAVVRFEVGGFPADVELFWEGVHARGVADGQTLANLLDVREDPQTEPIPSNLPATINPLQFVMENLLRNNLFVIRARAASFNEDAPGINVFKYLRSIIPPHTTYIVFVEQTVSMETVDLSAPGGEDEPGAEDDEVGVFDAANPVLDELFEAGDAPPSPAASYGDVSVTARQVSMECN
jgi:hypothetical protein